LTEIRTKVVLSGSVIPKTYFLELPQYVEPLLQLRRLPKRLDFDHRRVRRAYMPKAAHIARPLRASTAASEKSEGRPLIIVALFCGVGLLLSLIAIIMGVPAAWY
jgi:hypothetical protein